MTTDPLTPPPRPSLVVEQLQQDNDELRLIAFYSHGCLGKYGDDGEMQCAAHMPPIDFKRDTVRDIRVKSVFHGQARLQQQQSAIDTQRPTAAAVEAQAIIGTVYDGHIDYSPRDQRPALVVLLPNNAPFRNGQRVTVALSTVLNPQPEPRAHG